MQIQQPGRDLVLLESKVYEIAAVALAVARLKLRQRFGLCAAAGFLYFWQVLPI